MSTFAAARVETKIVLQGEGNAAKAVKETRDQLDGMGKSAKLATDQATGGFTQFATIASQKLSGLGGAISGINAVLGGTSPELQKIGQGFTAAGAVANILPGPIGLAAAAVIGLTVATYAFVKAADEADAKTRFMRGGAGSEGLAERIGVTQDAILGMQQSMQELRAKGLEPTEPMLIAVRQRAEAMGKDGAKAVQDFVSAIAKGPEAVRALQASIGDLGVGTTEELAKQLGLSLETIGAAKNQLDLRQKARDLESEYAAVLAEQKVLQTKLDTDQEAASKKYGAGVVDRLKAAQEAQERFNAAQPKQLELEGRLAALKAQATTIEAAAKAERDQVTQSSIAKTRAAQLDVQAGVTKNQNVAVGLRLQAVDERIADIEARRVLLASQQAGYSALEFNNKQEQLKLELAQAEAAKTQLIEADKAAQKAKREASAAKRKEQLSAEAEAVKKLRDEEAKSAEQAAKNAATDASLLAVRLRNLDADTAAERKAAREKANTAEGKATALRAIDLGYANARKKLEDDYTKAVEEQARFVADKRREAFEVELQAELEAQTKIDELQRAQQATIADNLRARGKFHEATLVEVRQAEADHAAAVLKIQQDLAIALTGIDEDSDVARKQRQLADAQVAAQARDLAAKTAAAYAKESEAITATFKSQVELVQSSVETAIGGSGDLVKSAFSRSIEEAQASLEGLEGDAAKAGKDQVRRLQDQAKEAEKAYGKFSVLGGALAKVTQGVQSGTGAWDAYGKAQKSGDTEAITKATQGLGTALDSTISASGAAAAAFVDDEKTKAGILALTETAAAIVAFATPGMQAQGVAHAAAAAIYASVAGGAIPSGGAGGATAAGGEAATTGGGAVAGTTGQSAAGGGGTTTVINFNKGFIFGTQQEVAKGISGTLRSIGGTGYDKRKAV